MQSGQVIYSDEAMMDRLRDDLIDSLDEEFEIELEDGESRTGSDGKTLDARKRYFRELFRLQGESPRLP